MYMHMYLQMYMYMCICTCTFVCQMTWQCTHVGIVHLHNDFMFSEKTGQTGLEQIEPKGGPLRETKPLITNVVHGSEVNRSQWKKSSQTKLTHCYQQARQAM